MPGLESQRTFSPTFSHDDAAVPRSRMFQNFLIKIIRYFERCSRPKVMAAICGLVLIIAVLDYRTGYQLTFSLFYLGAVALATWLIGLRFAIFISVVSWLLGFIGDLLAGGIKENLFAIGWNGVLAFGSYIVVAGILSALRSLQNQLGVKVTERTVALTAEMGKREFLEKELLAISEREQRRIGHDLHDSLCQHLTATALAVEVMREKLVEQGRSEAAAEAKNVINLIVESIGLARSLARGLSPVALELEGLMDAFHEMARSTSERFRINCRFECPRPVLIADSAIAGHLFRIAQESVSNAVRHGGADRVSISLTRTDSELQLRIDDNGRGIGNYEPGSKGMGMHIMRHRAQMIGGNVEFHPLPQGTSVECTLPMPETAVA